MLLPVSDGLPTTPQHPHSLQEELEPGSATSFHAPPVESNSLEGDATKRPDDCSDYELFVESIAAETVAFERVSDKLFVASGWDSKKSRGLPSWYHIQRFYEGNIVNTVCRCPQARLDLSCVHSKYLKEEGCQRFPFSAGDTEAPPNVVLFRREVSGLDLDNITYYISVTAPGRTALQDRSIIIYESAAGVWTCSKDGLSAKGTCTHIELCRQYLALMDANIVLPDDDLPEAPNSSQQAPPKKYTEGAISYLPIPPPLWTLLPDEHDQNYIPRLPANTPPPAVIRLAETSACDCQFPRHTYNPFLPVVEKPCTIYTLTHAVTAMIETQEWSGCKQMMGPDCRELNIFNLNNHRLFSHHLIDAYTSAFCGSKTPFAAWVKAMSQQYTVFQSPIQFAPPDVFRWAWFCYARLQTFRQDMICPSCGPYPKTIVCDGISLSFHSKHVADIMEPPTTITSHSQRQEHLKYFPSQQLLKDRKLRKRVREVVQWKRPSVSSTGTSRPEGTSSEDDENIVPSVSAKQERVNAKILAHAKSLPDVCGLVKGVDHDVGVLFESFYGLRAMVDGGPVLQPYNTLFAQICAEESVLQMITLSGAEALETFIASPTTTTATHLITIPALSKALEFEFQTKKEYTGLLCICRWLLKRYREVFAHLLQQHDELRRPDETIDDSAPPWHKTGTFIAFLKCTTGQRIPS
ncbi:hypothetical protein HGRIS_013307 [Hohenbuehelia grisea]|uniref:HMG domain-containing protein n=1 Tax=Hohenbuehelia grisea TaxID=104357 RepID=A0ABR3IV73_9AGAR